MSETLFLQCEIQIPPGHRVIDSNIDNVSIKVVDHPSIGIIEVPMFEVVFDESLLACVPAWRYQHTNCKLRTGLGYLRVAFQRRQTNEVMLVSLPSVNGSVRITVSNHLLIRDKRAVTQLLATHKELLAQRKAATAA